MIEQVHNPANFQVSLKLLLKNSKGEHLLLQTKSRRFPGSYDLPGGRINKDELTADLKLLIKREVLEEAGNLRYSLRNDPVAIGRYDKRRVLFFYVLFEAEYRSGKIVISSEHQNYVWKKLNQENYKTVLNPSLHEVIKNYFQWNKQN